MIISSAILLRPFKPFIEKTSADFKQVCRLVDLKLLLDNRKTNPNLSRQRTDPKNTLVRQSLLYLFVGTIFSLMFLKSNDIFLIAFATHIYLMVMVSISMMAEYSVSLFDTRDNNLIIPLPVSGQTLGWARVLHILLYLLLLTFSLILPALITTGVKFGLGASLLFMISSLLNTVFTLFLTIFIYLGMMRFTSGEKLKDVLMYIQVGLTILIMIGYQIGPRYMMENMAGNVLIQPGTYFILIPPAWFAMLASIGQSSSVVILVGSIAAIVIPFILMIFIGKKLFYGFENKLSQLNSSDVSNVKVIRQNEKNKNNLWFQFIGFILGVPRFEMPIFRLMWNLTGRERLFKQSILPMIAYMVVIPIFSVFTVHNLGNWETKYTMFLYFTIMTSSMIPNVISIGNNSQTIWIFKTIPELRPATIFSNTIKAALGRFFIPVFLIMVIPLFYFKGFYAIFDMVTLFLFNYFMAYAILYFQSPIMPFSQTKAASQGGKTALRMMLILFLAFPLGMLHTYLSRINGFMAILPAFVFLPLLIGLDKKWYAHKINWKSVELGNKP